MRYDERLAGWRGVERAMERERNTRANCDETLVCRPLLRSHPWRTCGESSRSRFTFSCKKLLYPQLFEYWCSGHCDGANAFLFDNKDCRVVHSAIIVVGSIVNMLIASFFGVVTPLAAARFNFDPSAIAGPFETAMQDMLGFMVLMYMAKSMILSFGGASCPLDFGNMTVTVFIDSFNFGCLQDVCLGSLRCYKIMCGFIWFRHAATNDGARLMKS